MKLSFHVETHTDDLVKLRKRLLNISFRTKHSSLSWEYDDCIFRGYPEEQLVDVDYLSLEMGRVAEKVWASIPLTQYDLADLHGLVIDMHHHFLGVMSSDLTFGEFLDILSQNNKEIEDAEVINTTKELT